MTRRALLAVFLAFGAAALRAGELAGVKMPDTDTVEGKTLKLNGMGLRTKLGFKVYVLGLYVENPSKDAATIISSDQIKSVRMSLLRDVTGPKISEAIADGFQRNSAPQMGALKARLDQFAKLIPDSSKGDEIVLTYVPGKGTVVAAKGAEKGVIEGKDFADALFAVWLGANPVQDDLKKAMLGGS